jgi:hypothetical protein
MNKHILISVLGLVLAIVWGGYVFAQTENPAGDLKVPPDVEQFLNEYGSDVRSRDVEKVMIHYSDRYLNDGIDKQGAADITEALLKPNMFQGIKFFEPSVTEFELQGDKAYMTGFFTSNYGKLPIHEHFMIKEEGQWKWYGNQK